MEQLPIKILTPIPVFVNADLKAWYALEVDS